ncbi:MAG TPA: hypothetical protein VKY92_21380 [Verrucomicrobiae bacterium]|nr:hypothetical protein [Verrucomicrobiae bacterium]
MKTTTCNTSIEEKFFGQLEEFCRLVQEEFLARFDEVTAIPASAIEALEFSETLILCPTLEAARISVRRELASALSFVLAIQGMQRRLQLGQFKLPTQAPAYQTHFYLLACTVQEFLQTAHSSPVLP